MYLLAGRRVPGSWSCSLRELTSRQRPGPRATSSQRRITWLPTPTYSTPGQQVRAHYQIFDFKLRFLWNSEHHDFLPWQIWRFFKGRKAYSWIMTSEGKRNKCRKRPGVFLLSSYLGFSYPPPPPLNQLGKSSSTRGKDIRKSKRDRRWQASHPDPDRWEE